MYNSTILIIAAAFSFILLAGCHAAKALNVEAGTADTTGGYKLVWADEFNANGSPDTTAWSFEKGFVRNGELQWYQPENATCKNGLLVIEGRRETKPHPGFEPGSNDWKKKRERINYTASSIHTRGKHAWRYGRFIMRGRIAISPGLWPAWWTLGEQGGWPANGEIDIMEYYGNKVLANVACLGPGGKPEWFTKIQPADSLGGAAWAARFHTWRMDWDENAIALYMDDQLVNSVALGLLVNKDGSGVNPFTRPHYMLLNLAVGGINGGDPAATRFPNKFEIDYVRVYQK
ncbi:MAG: glycoside hydrolase family 16 protein [Chitinophagaceae bacterium]